MAIGDLCTRAAAREWAGSGGVNVDDPIIDRLITAVSRTFCGYLSRPLLLPHTANERYDGSGKTRLMLRQWPVTAIASLTIDGQTIPAATPGASPSGYLLELWDGVPPGRPQSIDLFGYCFGRGRQNVQVSYPAGYAVIEELVTIPDSGALDVAMPFGPWGSDVTVAFQSGAALTAVASSATPATGQYALAADKPGGYQFAVADAAKAVLISYGFIPADIFHACAEQVGERYRYKDRIGQVSKSLGGQETTAYSIKDMPDAVKLMLAPYRHVVPF